MRLWRHPHRVPRHPVLAAVSRGCPGARGRFPRVTHPSATRAAPEGTTPVRLACVRRAASVRSEPGSNSQLDLPYALRRTGCRLQRHHCTRPTLGRRAAAKDPLKGDRCEPRPRANPGHASPGRLAAPKEQPATAGTTDSAPPPYIRMPEPRDRRPPPTHPFLPYPTCPKTNPAPRATPSRLALPANDAL
jgi:hypothetical protein